MESRHGTRDRLKLMTALVAVVTIAAALLAAPGARADVLSVEHELSVRLLPDQRRLEAVAELLLRLEDEHVVLARLARQAEVREVLIDGRRVSHSLRNGVLAVTVPGEKRTGLVRMRVAYAARFDDPFEERPLSVDNPGQGVQGAIVPHGAFLLAGSGWYPEVESGSRLFRIEVRAPRGMYAVTQGALAGHEDQEGESISRWKAVRPVGGLALAAGRYVVGRVRSGQVDVLAYFTDENRDLMERYLDASGRHLELYEGLFGPYPFEKFAVVENFFPTGYGFPSFTVLGGAVLRLPFIPDTSLMHEIAHCWWGNGVLVDMAQGNWSEGLATYVADYLARERESPEAGREYRLGVLRDYATLAAGERDFPLSMFVSRTSPASQVIGYGKGMFVFHMVRRHIGDEAFWEALRLVARERMFQAATWGDFREAFCRVSGWDETKSRVFFAQWIDRAGAPRFSLVPGGYASGEGGFAVRAEIQQARPFYSLSMSVAVEAGTGRSEKRVSAPVETTRVAVSTADRPVRLLVDPEAHVFRLLSPEEIPPTVNSARGVRRLVTILGRSLPDDWRDVCDMLLAALGRNAQPPLHEDQADASLGRGQNVLFCGAPETAAWRARLARLPRGLTVSADGFAVEGLGPERAADTLFAVFPAPDRDGTFTAGLFVTRDAGKQDVAEAVRRIPHYGKSGYVAFGGGVNVFRGTFEPKASPLVIEFGEAP